MRGLVTYDRPYGLWGSYVFTVVIDVEDSILVPPLTEPKKSKSQEQPAIEIQVVRQELVTKQGKETIEVPAQRVYSCGYCGRWATISYVQPPPITRTYTYQTTENTTINPAEKKQIGTLIFYRYDNVEPGDVIWINMRDKRLLFWQATAIRVGQDAAEREYRVHPFRRNPAIKKIPSKLYGVLLFDWHVHVREKRKENKEFSVEEELIQNVMNAEPITITELELEPAHQAPALESGQRFIEGQLKYL